MHEFLRLPINAAAHGGEIDQMIYWVHYLMFALFIGWGSFFLFTLFRFCKSRNPKANYKGVKSHVSSYLEVAVVVIEVVLLIGFSIPIYAKRVNAFPPKENAVNVRVVAEQFAWNVHYAGADGIFGKTDPTLVDVQSNPLGIDATDPAAKDDIATINQLHLPVNKPVIIQLSSKDVIHSFGVPLLRVKQDAVPGMTIPLWFEPNKTGEFEVVCSQLCGLGHYRMKGFITVHEGADYEAWLSAQPTFGANASSADSWL